MKSWSPQSLLAFAAFFALTANALSPLLLQRRDGQTCPQVTNLKLSSCPDNLPFCCPDNTSCMPTSSDNSTVMCCPAGTDCAMIQPITCDIQMQNYTAHPETLMHTTRLGDTLSVCGSSTDDKANATTPLCCPHGYDCHGSLCLNPSAISKSPTNSPSASSTPPVIIPTSIPNSDETAPKTHSNPFPPAAVLLGLFLGLFAGVLITLLIVWLLKRRKGSKNDGQQSPDFMGTTPRASYVPPATAAKSSPPKPAHSVKGSNSSTISEPMWTAEIGGTHRTDFLRRGDSKTGFERSNKPMWSSPKLGGPNGFAAGVGRKLSRASSKKPGTQRGQSQRRFDHYGYGNANPYTPPNQTSQPPSLRQPEMSSKRDSRQEPLFTTPLRFGLPLNPKTSTDRSDAPDERPQTRGKTAPTRPARSDDYGAKLETATAIEIMTPAASQTPAHQPLDALQPRPLVRHNVLEKAQQHQPQHQRSDSVESSSSIESAVSRSPNEQFKKRDASSETINVLMPPPDVYSQKEAHQSSMSAKTTFTDLMVRAGYHDDWHQNPMPNSKH